MIRRVPLSSIAGARLILSTDHISNWIGCRMAQEIKWPAIGMSNSWGEPDGKHRLKMEGRPLTLPMRVD